MSKLKLKDQELPIYNENPVGVQREPHGEGQTALDAADRSQCQFAS